MAYKASLEIAKNIGDMIHDISLMTPGWMARATSAEEAHLLELRKSIALLVETLATRGSYPEVMKQYESLVGAIDVAGITGLLGEKELPNYYKLVDDLWAAIEKEKEI